jgi:hypothetical protein
MYLAPGAVELTGSISNPTRLRLLSSVAVAVLGVNGSEPKVFGFTISRVVGGSTWIAYRTREFELPAIVTVLNKWVSKS